VVNYYVVEYPVKSISEAYSPDGGHLMKFHRAEFTDNLKIEVGETIELESLRQPVALPYLMLMPFVEVPDEIIVEGQSRLDEDGVHGCVYQLKAKKTCEGEIAIGFRDIQTGEVTHRKVIQITAS
jgi:hypothetical protein